MANQELSLSKERNALRLLSWKPLNFAILSCFNSGCSPKNLRTGISGHPIINAGTKLLGPEENDTLGPSTLADFAKMMRN